MYPPGLFPPRWCGVGADSCLTLQGSYISVAYAPELANRGT